MSVRGALLVALIGLVACTATVEANSGIFGQVVIGPQCPVVAEGMEEECADKPYQATILVKTEDGSREVTRFTSDANGQFRVALPPGTYLLEPIPGGSPFPFGKPQLVEVREGQYTEVTILYDTGIR